MEVLSTASPKYDTWFPGILCVARECKHKGRLRRLNAWAIKEGAWLYSTHSLRAATATLLLDAEIDIRKVQEVLDRRHVTTIRIYRRRATK